MNEDFFKRPSTEEEQEEDLLIHSLEYRNPLQILVFKMLGIENNIDRIMKYSDVIRNFIGNPDNTEVRRLIIKKDFEGAAKILVDEIHKEEYWSKAA